MANSIDYGMGRTNIDTRNGIRYGVISVNEVTQAWCDSSEPDYGEPHCPKCGNEATPYDDDKHGELLPVIRDTVFPCPDYVCESCEGYLESSDAFGDEPLGHNLSDGEYKATQDSDGDIFILESPYFTLCEYCSPCAPGAGYLVNAGDVRAYCFGHDWFDDGKAPYRIYSVATGDEVMP